MTIFLFFQRARSPTEVDGSADVPGADGRPAPSKTPNTGSMGNHGNKTTHSQGDHGNSGLNTEVVLILRLPTSSYTGNFWASSSWSLSLVVLYLS